MFKRKSTINFLDMVPVKNVGEIVYKGDRIILLIPKFRNTWMMRWLIPSRRSTHFRIHLDETGSRVWEFIDGKRNVNEICLKLKGTIPNATDGVDETDLRVTKFLNQLYRNRFIVFKSSSDDNRHNDRIKDD